MTDERLCPKCGTEPLPPRCRVCENCLSSGSSSRADAAESVGPVLPEKFYDDDLGRFRWTERVWMVATCGDRVYTADMAGAAHGGCAKHTIGCTYIGPAVEQPEHTDQIDWSHIDMVKVMPEPPSTFEAAFPEVRPRFAPKEEDEEVEVISIPERRRQMLDEIERLGQELGEQVLERSYRAAKEDVLGTATGRAKTQADADLIAAGTVNRLYAEAARSYRHLRVVS